MNTSTIPQFLKRDPIDPTPCRTHPLDYVVMSEAETVKVLEVQLSLQCLAGLALGDGQITTEPLSIKGDELSAMLGVLAGHLNLTSVSLGHILIQGKAA